MFNYDDVVLGLSSLFWTSGVPILLLGTLQLIKWQVIFAQFGNDIVCSYRPDLLRPRQIILCTIELFGRCRE